MYTRTEPIWGRSPPSWEGTQERVLVGGSKELRGGLSTKFTGGGGAWHFTPPLALPPLRTPEAY